MHERSAQGVAPAAMQQMSEDGQPRRVGRIVAIIGLGLVVTVAIQIRSIGARPIIGESRIKTAAAYLVATAHDWSEAAARRRAALEAVEAARQARIDLANQDLLDHD